ncbi:hypothetical protein BGZ76_006973 [Entomortierella beljakovae]|nr:hypothetical protein BGZ76_006973 [Entomortierella beljakovae]
MLFPNAPKIQPPLTPTYSLDIFEILKTTLTFFDQELIAYTRTKASKVARTVHVDGGLNSLVPRESVYDTEMMRILANWLPQNGYRVIGQHHVGKKYCDITIKDKLKGLTVAIELVVTESPKIVQEHIDKTCTYMDGLNLNLEDDVAKEGWVVHFTREDNYLNRPLWPTDDLLQKGLNMAHIWHNRDFTDVQLSAKYKNFEGKITTISKEPIILPQQK